jgi:hypothetical protein
MFVNTAIIILIMVAIGFSTGISAAIPVKHSTIITEKTRFRRLAQNCLDFHRVRNRTAQIMLALLFLVLLVFLFEISLIGSHLWLYWQIVIIPSLSLSWLLGFAITQRWYRQAEQTTN